MFFCAGMCCLKTRKPFTHQQTLSPPKKQTTTKPKSKRVKMGPERAAALLAAGCNDMGGVLMSESITRAAGAGFGQELPPEAMEALIKAAGRAPRQRTTLYGAPPATQVARSFGAAPLVGATASAAAAPAARA
jgi:FO synthase